MKTILETDDWHVQADAETRAIIVKNKSVAIETTYDDYHRYTRLPGFVNTTLRQFFDPILPTVVYVNGEEVGRHNNPNFARKMMKEQMRAHGVGLFEIRRGDQVIDRKEILK